MPNSESQDWLLFFQAFLNAWQTGRGRGAHVPKRSGYEGEREWNKSEFIAASRECRGSVGDDILGTWLALALDQWVPPASRAVKGKPFMQRGRLETVLAVFFPHADSDARDREDRAAMLGHFNAEDRRRRDQAKPRKKSGAPPAAASPVKGNVPRDWEHTLVRDFPPLVRFRIDQPVPNEIDSRNYDLTGSLLFGKAAPMRDRDKIVELALRAAYLEISGTSYLAISGRTIGDPDRPLCHVTRTSGGQRIETAADHLDGDPFEGQERITTVEPGVKGGTPLTLRVSAKRDDFLVKTWRLENGTKVPVANDVDRVVQLLIERDQIGGTPTEYIAFAERQLKRRRGR